MDLNNKHLHLYQEQAVHDLDWNRESENYNEPWVGYSVDTRFVSYNLPVDNKFLITWDTLFDADHYDFSECLFFLYTGSTGSDTIYNIDIYFAADGISVSSLERGNGEFGYDYKMTLSKTQFGNYTSSVFSEFFHGYEKYYQQTSAPQIVVEGGFDIGVQDAEESAIVNCPCTSTTTYSTYDLTKSAYRMMVTHIRQRRCQDEGEGEDSNVTWNFVPTRNVVELEQPLELPSSKRVSIIDTQLVAYMPLYVSDNESEAWTSSGALFMETNGSYPTVDVQGWVDGDFIEVSGPGMSGGSQVFAISEKMMFKNDDISYSYKDIGGNCIRGTVVTMGGDVVASCDSEQSLGIAKDHGSITFVEGTMTCGGDKW